MDSLTPSQSMQLYGIDSKLQPSISSLLNSVHGRDNERATRMDRSFTVGLCRDLRNVHVFFDNGHHLTVKVNPADQARDICQMQVASIGQENRTHICVRIEVSERADARIAAGVIVITAIEVPRQP